MPNNDVGCDGIETDVDCDESDPNAGDLTNGADCDGFLIQDGCDDSDASVNPSAAEIWYDGVDQNCDGSSDYDQDEDRLRTHHLLPYIKDL